MFASSAVPLFLALCILHLCDSTHSLGDVIYAINAGGEEHVDVHGIHYKRDPLFGKTGTASDYGKLLVIGRVPKSDHILYQTERYHTATFGYDIPVNKDGNYVLVLKFSEVYFDSPGRKVRSQWVRSPSNAESLPKRIHCRRTVYLSRCFIFKFF